MFLSFQRLNLIQDRLRQDTKQKKKLWIVTLKLEEEEIKVKQKVIVGIGSFFLTSNLHLWPAFVLLAWVLERVGEVC